MGNQRTKMSGSGGKGRYFRRSLALLLMIASVPSLFIAVSNYWIGIRQIEKEAIRSHQLRTEQVSEMLANQFDQIAIVMSRWSTNPLFGDYLDRFSFLENISQSQELMQSLTVVGGSNLFIDEARLYLGRQRTLVSAEGIQSLSGARLEAYSRLLKQHEGLFLAYDLPLNDKGAIAPVSMIFKLPWYADKPFGAFVLNLSGPEIERSVGYLQTGERGAAFLMQKNGEWITKPEERASALSDALRSEVLDRADSKEGFFPFEWQGKDYQVSFSRVTQAEWMYVTASPVSELLKPVLATSRWLAAAGLVGLAAGLALSWVATERLHRPIRRLVRLFGDGRIPQEEEKLHELEYLELQWARLGDESRTLRDRLKRAEPSLREGFLLQLVQGHLYALSESDLRERMEHLGWPARDSRFAMLLIQLSGLSAEQARFRENDRQLVSFAAANIAQELADEQGLAASAINFQNLSVGLLHWKENGEDPAEAKRELLAYSQRLIGALSNVLRMHATIIVSRWTDRLGSVPELLEQARKAVSFRDLQEIHQVIDLDEFGSGSPRSASARYPIAEEDELLHAMWLGLPEESESRYELFMDEVEKISESDADFRNTCLQLLGRVRGMLIELGFTMHPLIVEGRVYEEVLSLPDPIEVRSWMWRRIVRPYLDDYGKAQNVGARRLVEQAVDWIGERYAQDLPLEACAEQLHTSPYTLSRSFKLVLGVTYVEHIQNLRLAKAKELLLSTTLRINEVAERVGYQHSYFNKLFKGETGLTPTQYRESFRHHPN
ncbi:AraC family transcriptional regulator [Cohnella xylanilytica]|uniref:AraC family transcriptional regulator n=1 Tax=Cohnella xylanilytica TaxID=557555 RepID=A0A841U3T4_9BACL|nr:AraC family transcriptional regulator [Cohnella xylanilytica]MBB6692720.1 AraC family transcriptional regulator [Cohnella xylanilytica]